MTRVIDGELSAGKRQPPATALREQQAEGRRLDTLIGQALRGLGYGG